MSSLTTAAAAARRTPFELLLLGAIWGASFLFMRIAAAAFGALALVEIRLCLGALVLLPFAFGTLRSMPRSMWLRLAAIGFVNTAAPFLLFAWAAQHAPAGVVAITNSTTVMCTALFGWLLYGERIAAGRIAGLIAGFVGVATLASGNAAGQSISAAVLAGTIGAILYGLGGNLSARQLVPRLAPSAIAAGTLSVSAVLLAPLAVLRWPANPIAPAAWLAAAALGLFCTGTAYLLYYRIMHRIGAAGVATVTYLIPLFGVLWAWLLLGERLTATTAIAGALILFGVFLSQRR